MLLQGSGLWQKLNAVKPISCEPRGSGEDFDAVMTRYYEGIQRGVGGLFFAVCRGKVLDLQAVQYDWSTLIDAWVCKNELIFQYYQTLQFYPIIVQKLSTWLACCADW